MKKMFAINFYPIDCDEILLYTKQDYYWPRNLYLNYFEAPYIPQLKEELHVEENIVLKDYLEVKERNIEISEEINEGLVMEEYSKIKIIVKENNKDHIIEKDLELNEIEEESFNRPLSLLKKKKTIIQSIKFRFFPFYFLVNSRPFLLVDSRNFRRFKEPL